MRRALCLGLVAALLLWAPAVLAKEVGGGEAKQPPKDSGLRGEYGIMASVLKLDDATKAKLEAELAKLSEARAKVEADGKANIMALLTDEQKVVWEGFELRRIVMQGLRSGKLSEEQTGKVQKLCEEKAKTLPAVTDEKSRAARSEAIAKVRQEVVDTILTEEQKAAANKPPEKKPEPRKEEPKKEGPKKEKE